jgi:Skp family chaperone for outer membrane proteins
VKLVYKLLLGLSLAATAAAVQAADLKIGFIDADRINRASRNCAAWSSRSKRNRRSSKKTG